jgi:hypothetical protein
MINLSALQIGDIIGTTSGSPLATLIKLNTWGWRFMFSQKKASHIATVVDRGHGLYYFAEMQASGIALTEIHAYCNVVPMQHVCWVGRNPELNNLGTQVKYNNAILALHARRVKYGYDDLFDYITERVGIHIRDKENRIICSELPRVAYKQIGISYPPSWEGKCSPMDWQEWETLEDVTKSILA